MLGRLQMSVDEAIASFLSIVVNTFPKKRWRAGNSRTKRLEKAIANLVHKYAKKENPRMIDTEGDSFACKTFVCVAYGHNLGGIECLRTYEGTKNQAPNYTVEEALLATTAIRGTFEPRVIQEDTGLSSVYVAADLVCGNPINLLLEEARDVFPGQHIACIISFGSGHPQVASILDSESNFVKNPGELVTILEGVTKDCEKTAQDIHSRFREIDGFYFRFNVDQGMQSIRESDYQQTSAIQAHTRAFVLRMGEAGATGLDSAVQAIVERKEAVATFHLTGTVHALSDLGKIQPCPPPSPNFTGRTDALQMLLKYFTTPSRIQRSFVLYGLGGSGKTQIARTFIEQYRHYFSEVYYIDATSTSTIELCFKNIARAKHISQTVDDIFCWLVGQNTNWMIYYDNADSQLDLRRYFPSCQHGNLLITTQNKTFVTYSRDLGHNTQCQYAVSGMSPRDAESLLLRLSKQGTGESERNQASKVVEMLGFHALAITQAGAYIRVQDYRLNEFVEQCLATDRLLEECIPAKVLIDDDYPRRLYATWMLTYEKLAPDTLTLLHYFAFMHHTGITEGIFSAAHNQIYHQGYILVDPLASFLSRFNESSAMPPTTSTWSSSAFRNATMEARSYSLIEYDRQTSVYSIHPLVHKWIRRLAPKDFAKSAALLLALCARRQDRIDGITFRCALLPHIDALPEAQRADPSVAEQFSRVYCEAGRWTEAENLQKFTLSYRKKKWGENHPKTLSSMHMLGILYREQGRWELAEQTLRKTMEARKKLPEGNILKVMDSANQLAWVYLEQSKWEITRAVEGGVLQARRHSKDELIPKTLESMSRLSLAYRGLKRLLDTQRLEEEVFETKTRLFRTNYPYTLMNTGTSIWSYKANDLLGKAEFLAGEVLGYRSRLLGRHHPQTLVTMCNPGGIYLSRGRLSDAEGLLEEVAKFGPKTLCKKYHPHTLSSIQNLAAIYALQGQWKKAEELMAEVLNQQKAFGLDADFLLTLHNLALIHAHQNNWLKALESMREVVEGRKEKLGEKHPSTVASIECLKGWEATIDASRSRSHPS
ncbi:hypothetical protein FRC09_004968 [Ceratobasidium sp. 395]|nr:hypothetical protein FRC09_004968 [Ceratobasidium sp. 395]